MTKGRFNGSGTFRFWPLRSIFQIRQFAVSVFFWLCTTLNYYNTTLQWTPFFCDIVDGAKSEYAHTTHHAPIGRASTALSQPDVSLQKTLHKP